MSLALETKSYFQQWVDAVKNKDWTKLFLLCLPIILTIAVVVVFKVKLWTPAKKRTRRYVRRARTYVRRQRARYTKRYRK